VAGAQTSEDMAETLLAVLRQGAPVAGQLNARSMLAAATTFLREAFGDDHARRTLSAMVESIKAEERLHLCEPSPAGAY
jgi:gamma-glutamyl:cysteine ligase YbdK (ATP-grasp superfamily)